MAVARHNRSAKPDPVGRLRVGRVLARIRSAVRGAVQLLLIIPPMPKNTGLVFSLLLGLSLLSGCATHIAANAEDNPPPKEALSAFTHFEVQPITMGAPYAGQEANEAALKKIQENFDLRVNPLIASWNAKNETAANPRTLRLEPYLQDIKFVNATARVWAGAMAGSSAVVLRIRLIDAATGEEVAHPEFFQRAAAMGGAWTFGSTDNNMLVRITELASGYLTSNYPKAVGGPTGKPPAK